MIYSKKMSLQKVCREFVTTTSIHGLLYAFLKCPKMRHVWKVIWLVMFSLCVYQSVLNMLTYLSFATKVSITYEAEQNVQFPSITFASVSLIRRKEFGNFSKKALLLATWLADKENQYAKLMVENEKTCRSDFQSAFIRKFELDEEKIIFKEGTIKLLQHIMFTYEYSLLKCSWKDVEINCSDCFMNYFSDRSAGFTFNAGNEMVVEQNRIPIPDMPLIRQVYGLNMERYNEKNYTVNSPNQGLRLLMNVNQNELCGNDNIKRGAGFLFIIHDINTMGLFLLDNIYYLTPGYSTDIAISRMTYRSNLERWGQCSSNIYLEMFPYLKGKNKQMLCLLQCVNEITLKQCNCYPPQVIANHKLFQQNAAKYGMLKDDVKFCWEVQDTLCMNKLRTALYENGFAKFCPHCKRECTESKYEVQITKSRMKFPQMINKSDKDDFFKNYLSANFYFSRMDVQLIEISEAFTLRDLFIYIGGNIGLFLGMSFMSLFEVADLIFHLCSIMRIRHKNRVRIIRHVRPFFRKAGKQTQKHT